MLLILWKIERFPVNLGLAVVGPKDRFPSPPAHGNELAKGRVMATQTVPVEDMAWPAPCARKAAHGFEQRREAAGLSQRELAERVEVGYYTFVSQIEAGRGRIPSERYSIWASALDMDARDFVRRIMAYYEPTTYEILFGDRRRHDRSIPSRPFIAPGGDDLGPRGRLRRRAVVGYDEAGGKSGSVS